MPGALLKHLETPGLHVGDLFIAVRQDVLAKPGSQRPVEYGSLVEKVYLASAPSPPPRPKDPAAPAGGGASPSPSGDAARAYEAAERVGTVAAFRAIVKRFPGTLEAELARAQIDKLEGAKGPLVVAGGDPVEEEPPATLSPAEGEKGLDLSREERRLVQMGLAAAGHPPGSADGVLGGKTRRALKAWQVSKEVEATGYLTREQSEALVALGKREEERRLAAEQRAREEAERKAREAEARRKKPGTKFRDCPECPEMVVVPAGSFRMGSPESEEGRDDDEGPMRRVTISEPFAVGKYEVTFSEWDACVSAGGCEGRRPDDRGWGRGDRPVINVNGRHAQAYVAWLSERTGKRYRLLSESEWEYAARAGTTTRYSWGDRIGRNRANCDGCGSHWVPEQNSLLVIGRTVPVGSFAANGFRSA